MSDVTRFGEWTIDNAGAYSRDIELDIGAKGVLISYPNKPYGGMPSAQIPYSVMVEILKRQGYLIQNKYEDLEATGT